MPYKLIFKRVPYLGFSKLTNEVLYYHKDDINKVYLFLKIRVFGIILKWNFVFVLKYKNDQFSINLKTLLVAYFQSSVWN